MATQKTTRKPASKRSHKAPAAETVLMLRTCRPTGESYGGFLWPLTVGAEVSAPDWSPEPECGHGLHGLVWGEGDGSLLDWSPEAIWLVWQALAAEVVRIDGDKAKAPRGVVVHVGTRETAAAYVAEHGGAGRAIVAGTATAGDAGTATAGYAGTATAGARGTATAGARGTATAGDDGTATAGYAGTATAGDAGTATAGARGTATAGARGTATAGYAGTATAGYAGTATAGARGTATAGARGTVCVRWWDSAADRYRTAVGYVGEDGIEPGVSYRWDSTAGRLVPADGRA